jgi:hypothetical protein
MASFEDIIKTYPNLIRVSQQQIIDIVVNDPDAKEFGEATINILKRREIDAAYSQEHNQLVFWPTRCIGISLKDMLNKGKKI